jgi:hypothetical protein
MTAKLRKIAEVRKRFSAAMQSPESKFKSLNDLVLDWSKQGGCPLPLTLRRICDWAICGAFPEGTFIFTNGERIDLLDLHRAMRNVVGLASPMSEAMAVELLRRTFLNLTGIEAFCESVGIDLPKSLKTFGSRVRWLSDKPPHSSPPDCPNGADTAARLEALFFADGLISSLELLLRQRQSDLECNPSEYVGARWLRYVKPAELAVESCGDPEIARKLATLKHEWDALNVVRNQVDGASSRSDDRVDFPSTERKKRAAGRPKGSGSFERSDFVLVKDMRRGIENEDYSSISAAARALAPGAAGHGTPSSKERRLIDRYSELYPS